MDGGFILIGALSGACVVLGGALYALLFAFGKLRESRPLLLASYLAYGLLAASALVLAGALGLDGLWTLVVVAMLIGYLLAPAAVWHLCVGTHGGHSSAQHDATGG